MSTVSYANAASIKSPNSSSLESQIQELSRPTPQSMTLIATLQLLSEINTQTDVFLLPRSYIQNWLVWAYHQKVSKTEASRVEVAARLAADRLGLVSPYLDMKHTDPGPVDATILSVEGQPLLLRPKLTVVDGRNSDQFSRRIKHSPDSESEKKSEEDASIPTQHYNLDIQGDKRLCCAVPESFYEVSKSWDVAPLS